MLGWLSFIGQGIAYLGTMVLGAIVDGINAMLVAMAAVVTATFSLLPTISDAPALGSGASTWLGWLNWFYPVGPLLDGLAGLVGIYLTFLAYRYVLRLLRAM